MIILIDKEMNDKIQLTAYYLIARGPTSLMSRISMSAVLIEILSGVQMPAKLSDEQSPQRIEMLEDEWRLRVPDRTDNPVLAEF
jgi:hypothetical protein